VSRLLANLLRWILQRLGWLVVILALLLAGSWLASEWRERERLRVEYETQQAPWRRGAASSIPSFAASTRASSGPSASGR